MKSKVAIGSILLILGFVLYQLSIFAVEMPTNFLGELAKILFATFSSGQPLEQSAILLRFVGGVAGIIGFIIAVSGVAASQQIDLRDHLALKSSIQTLQSSIQALQSSLTSTQKVTPQISCKFCGSSVPPTELFCPVCGKAQN